MNGSEGGEITLSPEEMSRCLGALTPATAKNVVGALSRANRELGVLHGELFATGRSLGQMDEVNRLATNRFLAQRRRQIQRFGDWLIKKVPSPRS